MGRALWAVESWRSAWRRVTVLLRVLVTPGPNAPQPTPSPRPLLPPPGPLSPVVLALGPSLPRWPLAVGPLPVFPACGLSPTVPPALAAPDRLGPPQTLCFHSGEHCPSCLASAGAPEPSPVLLLCPRHCDGPQVAWHGHSDGDGASPPILADMLSKEPPWCDGSTCYECAAKFGVTTRKHHW